MSGDGMTFAVGAPLRNDPSTDDGVVRVLKGVDSAQEPLAGRQAGSAIVTQYQAPEYDVWTLLDLALTEIAALKIKVATLYEWGINSVGGGLTMPDVTST